MTKANAIQTPLSADVLDVLVCDDDLNICRTLALSLKDQRCEVVQTNSIPEALAEIQLRSFDLILTDYRMEGRTQTGLDLIKEARRQDPNALIVVMTAFASFENAVSVVKEGAFDYLPKPFTNSQLAHLLGKIRVLASLKRENSELKRAKSRRDYFAGMTSPASRRLEEFVRKVAPTEATVLLVGESGTGKSELARLVHEWSPRAKQKFVTVQCTSLTESLIESELFGHLKGSFTGATHDKLGKLELANRGTLFLDEIGDLPISGQAKLLRFLQEKIFERVGGNEELSVDTRIIAATNKNLEQAVRAGTFREDLYYRLNVLECLLVPLRFRKEDILLFVQRFLEDIRERNHLKSPIVLDEGISAALLDYRWPGNIRELRNVLERIAMLSQGRQPQLGDLPDSVTKPPPISQGGNETMVSLEELEREHIRLVLAKEENFEKAAEILGITTVTLWRKRKAYGLN